MTSDTYRSAPPIHTTSFRTLRFRCLTLATLVTLGLGQSATAGENPVIPVEPMVFAPQGQFAIVPPQNAGTQGSQPQDNLLDPEVLDFDSAQTLSDTTTSAIYNAFNEATAFCSNIAQREYVADCFAYEYRRIADALPDTGDYAEVKRAVEQAADKMERVVRQEQSRTEPPARAMRQGANPRRTKRALRPVSTEATLAVAEATAQIIEEAQTVLIRSSENSEERRRQFQRIVAAMDTGTILLRSL